MFWSVVRICPRGRGGTVLPQISVLCTQNLAVRSGSWKVEVKLKLCPDCAAEQCIRPSNWEPGGSWAGETESSEERRESLAAGAQDPSGSLQLDRDLTLGMGRQKDLKGQGFGQTFREWESGRKLIAPYFSPLLMSVVFLGFV